jgi:hypothetical protein
VGLPWSSTGTKEASRIFRENSGVTRREPGMPCALHTSIVSFNPHNIVVWLHRCGVRPPKRVTWVRSHAQHRWSRESNLDLQGSLLARRRLEVVSETHPRTKMKQAYSHYRQEQASSFPPQHPPQLHRINRSRASLT